MVTEHINRTLTPSGSVYQGGERRRAGRLVAVKPSYIAHVLPMCNPVSGDTVLALALREPVRCTLTVAWSAGVERAQILYVIGNRRGARQPNLWLQVIILQHAAHQCAWLAYTRRGCRDETLYHDAHALLTSEAGRVQAERLALLSPEERDEAAQLDAAMVRTASGARRVVEARS